ncbi:MAG TPA: SMI1/KNR4 family protein [Pirellulaceae bacterium]|nr:SMI1/KNR4 family protein [Pirellulaceae bacterium]
MPDVNLVSRLTEFVSRENHLDLPPIATPEQVHQTERSIGFALPPLLRSCYLEIANGGFGQGYGIIGVKGGHESDFGDVVSTYQELKSCVEYFGNKWLPGLLPFCAWGCNIFSCVSCHDERLPIFTFEEGKVWHEDYNLNDFFEMWMQGEDILAHGGRYEIEEVMKTNPFTGAQMTVRRKKRVR